MACYAAIPNSNQQPDIIAAVISAQGVDMAVSSPNGTQTTTANAGKRSSRWRQIFWRLVWRIAVTAILGAIGAAAGFYTEALLKDLPRLPEQIRDAPDVVRIVVIALVAIVIALVIRQLFLGQEGRR